MSERQSRPFSREKSPVTTPRVKGLKRARDSANSRSPSPPDTFASGETFTGEGSSWARTLNAEIPPDSPAATFASGVTFTGAGPSWARTLNQEVLLDSPPAPTFASGVTFTGAGPSWTSSPLSQEILLDSPTPAFAFTGDGPLWTSSLLNLEIPPDSPTSTFESGEINTGAGPLWTGSPLNQKIDADPQNSDGSSSSGESSTIGTSSSSESTVVSGAGSGDELTEEDIRLRLIEIEQGQGYPWAQWVIGILMGYIVITFFLQWVKTVGGPAPALEALWDFITKVGLLYLAAIGF